MSKTQEKEEEYYKKFASAYGLPEKCTIKDKPDVRITQHKKNIGIEITNFYINNGSDISSEQQQAPIRKRVISEAQRIYEDEKGKGIEIHLGFNVIKNEKGLAKNIANWLINQNLTISGNICTSTFKKIPELRHVYISLGPYQDAKWHNSQAYSISNTSLEDLQKIIDRKEDKIDSYDKCDELWLLIVIDFFNFGMDQEPANVDYSSIIYNKFDKVILYKTNFDDIYEL